MSKHKFMSDLLRSFKFEVVNGIGWRTLRNGNVAKLEITDRGHRGYYNALRLTILSNERVLDVTEFRFAELLEHAPNNHPQANTREPLMVIEHCGWEWYINKPTVSSTRSMIGAVEKVISFFDN